MTTPAVDQLVEQFEDIVLQRHLMRPRAGDYSLVAEGWVLRHAVDTNILVTYITPQENAARASGRRGPFIGVGEIFRRDPLGRKEDISAALVYHIWHALQPEAPLLLLPPLQDEFRATINHYLAENVEAHGGGDHFQRLLARLSEPNVRLTAVELEEIRDAVLKDERRHGRVRRLRQLFANDRLRSAHSVLDPDDFDAAFRAALAPEARDMERGVALAKLKADWMMRIKALGRRESAEALRDAEALARVELANRRLEPQRHRLIYITSDNSLLEAGEGYKLRTKETGRTNFYECFLRHPRAYLDEPGVLNPHPSLTSDSTGLAEWMDVLLGQFDDTTNLAPPSLGRVRLPASIEGGIRTSALGDASGIGQFDIESRWSKYATASSKEVPEAALSFLRTFIESRTREEETAGRQAAVEQDITAVQNSLRALKDRTWEDFFVVSRANRLLIEISDRTGQQIREAAPACFEGRPKLLAFLSVARQWLTNETPFSREEYVSGLEEIRAEDPAGYSDYLGHANLLALQGHWRSAAILCVRAKERASGAVSNATGSNGREANYLEAFYRRYSAKSRDDLNNLDALLSKARAIAENEVVAVQNSGDYLDWPHDPVAERFTSEELALTFTRLLFDWAGNSSNVQLRALQDMVLMVPSLLDHARLLQSQIDAALDEPPGSRPARVTDPSFRAAIRQQLLRRSLRNVLMIGILNPECRQEASRAWSSLPRPDRDEGDRQSRYASFLWLCGASLFEERKRDRERALRNIILWRDGEGFAAMRVFPYDERRIKGMLRAIDAELR